MAIISTASFLLLGPEKSKKGASKRMSRAVVPSILVVAARMSQTPLARRERMRRPSQAMLALGVRGRVWKKRVRMLAVFQRAERQSC
ncbi:MAG: hypothetical protein L6R38_000166, partial [Xanthoria sp. 2 TBL-2021]